MLTLYLLLLTIVFFAGCFSSQGEEETNDSTGKRLSFSYIYSNFRYRPFKYKLQRGYCQGSFAHLSHLVNVLGSPRPGGT
jgi:hypothetical protein